jgi:hypothetical protein
VQVAHHQVQAAVAPGHHDPAAADAVEGGVELVGGGGGDDLAAAGLCQRGARDVDRLVVGAARVGAGEQQCGAHLG